MSKRIVILCNYQLDVAPGQRFRFEQYLDVLRNSGLTVDVAPFFAPWVWPILFKPRNTVWKVWAVVDGFARRFLKLATIRPTDVVFIHLEAAPIGPPIVEAILFLLGRRVVYDIDDAIFVSRTSAANWLAAPFRCLPPC